MFEVLSVVGMSCDDIGLNLRRESVAMRMV